MEFRTFQIKYDCGLYVTSGAHGLLVTFIREHRIHIQIKNSHISSEKPPYH